MIHLQQELLSSGGTERALAVKMPSDGDFSHWKHLPGFPDSLAICSVLQDGSLWVENTRALFEHSREGSSYAGFTASI